MTLGEISIPSLPKLLTPLDSVLLIDSSFLLLLLLLSLSLVASDSENLYSNFLIIGITILSMALFHSCDSFNILPILCEISIFFSSLSHFSLSKNSYSPKFIIFNFSLSSLVKVFKPEYT